MNKVCLTGNATHAPTIIRRNSGSEETVTAKCIIASPRPYNPNLEQQIADFIPFTVFGKKAEFVERNVKKGQKIEIVARLQSGSYTKEMVKEKEDGSFEKEMGKIYTLDVIVEDIRLLGPAPQSRNEAAGEGFLYAQDETPFAGAGNDVPHEEAAASTVAET